MDMFAGDGNDRAARDFLAAQNQTFTNTLGEEQNLFSVTRWQFDQPLIYMSSLVDNLSFYHNNASVSDVAKVWEKARSNGKFDSRIDERITGINFDWGGVVYPGNMPLNDASLSAADKQALRAAISEAYDKFALDPYYATMIESTFGGDAEKFIDYLSFRAERRELEQQQWAGMFATGHYAALLTALNSLPDPDNINNASYAAITAAGGDEDWRVKRQACPIWESSHPQGGTCRCQREQIYAGPKW